MSKTFKRSKTARLIMMVPAAGLVLAGCGEKPVEVQVFNSPDECAAYYNPPAECKAAFDDAKALHPQVAPRYASKQECETDFGAGQCENAPVLAANNTEPAAQQSQQSSGFFMPMMMGYMMGQMLNRGGAGGNLQQPAAAGAAGSKVPTQPLYKSRDDRSTFRTATNTPVAKGIGPISLKPSQVKPQAGQLVRRGGFGQQAAARNSFGG